MILLVPGVCRLTTTQDDGNRPPGAAAFTDGAVTWVWSVEAGKFPCVTVAVCFSWVAALAKNKYGIGALWDLIEKTG